MKAISRVASAWLGGIGIAMVLAPAAQAAPFANGGFETGDFTGWTLTGDTSVTAVDPSALFSGSYGALFGPTDPGGITQTFDATPGNYVVSFRLFLQDSAQPNSFSWSWNGVEQQPGFNNTSAFSEYALFSVPVVATGSSSTISFSFVNPQSFWLLDDVSVAAVPEPATFALLGAGLLLIALRSRRRS